MEAAKNAITGFLSGTGKDKTEVEENVQPAVTAEAVKPHQHQEVTQAIDSEVHHHHYHTTVQPLTQQEELPVKHSHTMSPVETKEFQHGDPEADRRKLAADAAQFQSFSKVDEMRHTSKQAPIVTGEHKLHHVHEIVQPVIHKEVIQSEVVHTTVPIHETHLAPSEQHGMSVLPPKTLEEFAKMGGTLSGSERRLREFEGDPKPYNPQYQVERFDIDKNFAAHDGMHDLESTGHFKPPSPVLKPALQNTESSLVDRPTTRAQSAHTSLATSRPATGLSGSGDDRLPHKQDISRETPLSSHPVRARDDEVETAKNAPLNATNSSSLEEAKPISIDDNVQHASLQGEDPALVKEKSNKLTGEGVDGSHSAVFGLTADGHKSDEVKN